MFSKTLPVGVKDALWCMHKIHARLMASPIAMQQPRYKKAHLFPLRCSYLLDLIFTCGE